MNWILPIICCSLATAFISICMMEYRLRSLHSNKFDFRISLKTIIIGLSASIIVYFIIFLTTLLLPMGRS